jgi:GNAT superfamily N-acetyltransferase
MKPIVLRFATEDDAETLAGHRVAMFREMGFIDPAHEAALHTASAAYFRAAIPAGEYVGWVGSPPGEARVIAGAGVQFRSLLPRPAQTHDGVLLGHEGLVLNVYTDKAWRRQGTARILMETIIAWARVSGIVHLVLGASDEGRPLYERLGFSPTREMRYTGVLAPNGPWTGGGQAER